MSDEDANWSEITILPDGRVYVFGMTMPLLELLAALPTEDNRWLTQLQHWQEQALQETHRE